MLAFRYRFHGHGGLSYVNRKGEVFRSRHIILKVVKSRRTHSRIAVVVSKKTLKSAVDRNRVRRRVYEIMRNELPAFNDAYDISCVVVSRDVRTLPYADISGTIKGLLIQANVCDTQ